MSASRASSAHGRGLWIMGNLVQVDTYRALSGVRAKEGPDTVAVALDGFFGWPRTAVAS